MAYIGKEPQVGNYVKLDAITTSSTNTYNLTKDSVAFVPESALHMLVSLNGVIQSPLSSFSVSGSTITFLPSSGTLSSSDTIDFILVLGNVLDIGTPSDSTVTNAKTNFVSTSSSAGLQIKGDGTTDGTLQLNCSQNSHGIKLASPAHSAGQSYTLTFPTTAPSADKALITDSSGNLSFGSVGKVLQVVHAEYSTQAVTTSSSFVATGLTVTITPSATSHKVLLFMSANVYHGTGGAMSYVTLHRGDASGTNLGNGNQGFGAAHNAAYADKNTVSATVLDSPSTTSAQTYTVSILLQGSGYSYLNVNGEKSTLTAMEIEA
jgi:hypothetical protein